MIAGDERKGRDNHFKEKDAKGPPVNAGSVSLARDHLGGDVFFRSHKTVGQEFGFHLQDVLRSKRQEIDDQTRETTGWRRRESEEEGRRNLVSKVATDHLGKDRCFGLLAEVEICQTDVTRFVQQNVLGLQIFGIVSESGDEDLMKT